MDGKLIVSSDNKLSVERFNGDWELNGHFPILSMLSDEKFSQIQNRKGQKLNLQKQLIPITIFDWYGDNPDPNPAQINAVNFILENEEKILESFFHALKKEVYPVFKDDLDDIEEWFPKLNQIQDVSKAIGITAIAISTSEKDDISYVRYFFEFSADDEHGLEMTFHKTRFIEFEAAWESTEEGVKEDLGLNYDDEMKKSLDEYSKRSSRGPFFHLPHPKYGKLKPWQKQENEVYPLLLMKKGRNQEFKNHILQSHVSIDGYIFPFLRSAIAFENEDLIDFCFSQNPKKLYEPFLEALKKGRFDLTDRIIAIGFDINSVTGSGSPMHFAINDFKRNFKDEKEGFKIKKRIEYLFSKGLNPYLKGGNISTNSFGTIKWMDNKDLKNELMKYFNKLSKDCGFGELDLDRID